MKLADYPRFTVIMRGYTFDQADAILQAMQEFDHQFAVEMTMNTEGAIDHIRELNKRYGKSLLRSWCQILIRPAHVY